MAENQLILEIEQALTGLIKLMKALRFYPEDHPSLNTAITECMLAFRPMLSHQDKGAIQANQTGFSFGNERIGEKNPALPDLARLLAERRVNQLIFLPDLPAAELLIFLQGVATPADEIYQLGGLPVFLRNHQVSSIWLNESSLVGALQKRQELSEEFESIGSLLDDSETFNRSDLAHQLRTIIDQLAAENSDDSYRELTNKLIALAPQYFEQAGPPGMLRILSLLLNHSHQAARNPTQQGIASGALERLLVKGTVSLLLAQFKRTALTPQQYQRLQQLIVGLGVRIAPQMLAQMSKEEDGTVRKRLSALLGKMGPPLLDLLREMVHSDKWYVVRNAIALLGDLRLESAVTIIAPFATHPDARVRRALIRSLTMIGGGESIPPLLKLIRDPDSTLHRPAVKALGATRSSEAVRPLLTIAKKIDLLGRKTELRSDAVSALGMLGNKDALDPLLSLAKRPNLFRLQRVEELRAEIILALGKIAGADNSKLSRAVAGWRQSPNGVVQRAAELCNANLARNR